MFEDYTAAEARRIVTGVDDDGKSYIVEDRNTPVRHSSDANTKCEIWRSGSVPVHMSAGDGLEGGVRTSPDDNGFVYRIVTFRPDSERDLDAGFADANGPLPGMVAPEEADGIPGLHFTESVDIVTVLSGELTAVMQDHSVTVLGPGDTLVQRGTKHSWSNRTETPTTAAVLMFSAIRD
ncbi:hypothetical protein [Brevibacterium sp. VCM10]|uniref:hypothetical protein n=1 Tax=Brevibacterium sp. VCM10 TaxID=1381751 RepID=UPI00047235A1|nr:hypothetical protein [Brevibacterium sp. VCM10]